MNTQKLIKAAARFANIEPADIHSNVREHREIRYIIMLFMHSYMKFDCQKIANNFQKDRSTVVSNLQTIENICNTEPEYRRFAIELSNKLIETIKEEENEHVTEQQK